jgi:hypothetical protein
MKEKTNQGFIGTILLVILGLAALKYFFNWSIFDAAASDEGRSTIGYIRDVLNWIWYYIGYPVTWTWHHVIWPVISLAWEGFQTLLDRGGSNS